MTSPLDHGTFFAESLLEAVKTQWATDGLAAPALASFIAGAMVPIFDCCDGLLWTRADTMYPTDGTGQPFQSTRIDFDLPAWAFPIQVGFLWCHQNIDSQGDFIDPSIEQEYAERDGRYRSSLYVALAELFPPSVQPWARGYRLSPWLPYGPEGGCSGGWLTVTVIADQLAQLV